MELIKKKNLNKGKDFKVLNQTKKMEIINCKKIKRDDKQSIIQYLSQNGGFNEMIKKDFNRFCKHSLF